MALRRIGQERLAVGGLDPRGGTSLDEVAALVDWDEIDCLLSGISASAKGEPGWPPLALFRALLLATWHDLSDVRLAEALDDRASFRRFCGFAGHEPTPERTAFVRFRAVLVRRGLDRALFEAVTRHLDGRGVVVRTETLVDATLIPSASIQHDPEARWAGHRRRKPVHGYKAHVATDQGWAAERTNGLIRGVEVTTANVHDAAELGVILPEAPGDTYGDSAFSGGPAERVIIGRGGRPRMVWTGIGAAGPRRSPVSKPTTPRSGACGPGSRRCSAPASALTACAGCAGWGWPRPACRSGWQRSPTTCAGVGACSGQLRREPDPASAHSEATGSRAEPIEGCGSSTTPNPPQRRAEWPKSEAFKPPAHRSHNSPLPGAQWDRSHRGPVTGLRPWMQRWWLIR